MKMFSMCLLPMLAMAGVAKPCTWELEKSLCARDAELDAEWSAVSTREALDAKRTAFVREFRKRLDFDAIARTPLNAKVTGWKDYGDFRVEKVLFESAPGVYVTALVFLPDVQRFAPPYAAFLFSPGHTDSGKGGASYLATCELGARNGLVAMIIDPLGQGERSQGAGLRSADEHVRIGAYAALVGKTTMTFMMRDAVRALDYLESRDDVDGGRLGATGCSGGGTMTTFLAVVEPRVKASAPSCYVSSVREHLDACGPQDAEQNFFDELGFGFNHVALVLAGGNPFLICAAKKDFFQIAGARSTFDIVDKLARRTGLPASHYGLVEAEGPHEMSQTHREAAVSFLARHLGHSGTTVPHALSRAGVRTETSCAEPHLRATRENACGTVVVPRTFTPDEIRVTPEGEVSKLPSFRSIYDELEVLLSAKCGGKSPSKLLPANLERCTKRRGKLSYYGRRPDAEEYAVELYLAGQLDPSKLDPAPFLGRLKKREYLSFAEFARTDAVPRNGRLAPVFDTLRPGAVRPQDWLLDWSRTAANGYVGRMAEVDPEFARAWTADFKPRGAALNWPKGAWSMEGGSYWFEGLVRLAWALDDPKLKALAKARLGPVLDNITTNAIGYVWWMDRNNPDHIAEISDPARGNGFPVLASGQLSRAVIAYYEATRDPRALRALEIATGDRRYTCIGNSENLPGYGVDAYRLGGSAAVAANLEAFYQGPFPREKHRLYRYAHPIDVGLLDMDVRSVKGNKRPWYHQHGVLFNENLYTWFKRAQWTGRKEVFDGVMSWFDFVETNCRQPHGLYVADESFGYPGFRRGTETCTIAGGTWMRLNLLAFTADGTWGDRAERGFFNAGAACVSRDYMHHCYFQAPNRFGSCDPRFDEGHAHNGDMRAKHEPLCCTAALARIIPECIQFAWMKRSADDAPVAALYGPYRLETTVKGTPVTITTRTNYPFEETLLMEVKPAADAEFPILLRVPSWCRHPTATIGGERIALVGEKGFAAIARRWTTAGTTITLDFPMDVELMQGVDRNAGQNNRPWCSLSYGPLLFALGFEEKDENTPLHPVPQTVALDPATVLKGARIRRTAMPAKWEWQLDAPLRLDVKDALGAARTLVPYGCTRIRISMFDVSGPCRGSVSNFGKFLQ